MKPFLLVTAVLAASPMLLSAEPASAPRQAVRAKLPAYSHEEHTRAVAEEAARMAARAAAKAASDADPDLVVLPPMPVIAKTINRMNEDSLLRKGAMDKELVKRELSGFDRYFLNRYTLPLFGTSKEVRAREAYLARQNQLAKDRLNRVARVIATEDPDEARALRRLVGDAPFSGQPTPYDWRPANRR